MPQASMMRMVPPIIMRYQPKALNPCLDTKLIKNLIARRATINATILPMIRVSRLLDIILVSSFISLKHLYTVAPNIVGTARKNENSAAAVLDTLIVDAPKIVEPERDVPGIKDKT